MPAVGRPTASRTGVLGPPAAPCAAPGLTERHARPEVLANPIGVDRGPKVESDEPRRPGHGPVADTQPWRTGVHSHSMSVQAISIIAGDPIGPTDPEYVEMMRFEMR